MKFRLPLLGEVSIGKQEVPKKEKSFLLGTFMDLGGKKLSNEKTISSKLVESFYEWVYINVTTLSEEISKFEPELHKAVLRQGNIVYEPVPDHPLLDLLDQFNTTTTRSDGFYLTGAYLELCGEAFWFLEGGAGNKIPTAIYLLQPDKVKLDINADGTIAGYEFSTVIDGKERSVSYEPEEILHIKVPNPKNQFRGHSVIEGIAESIDIDTQALITTRKFYENGMMANFMLSTDQKLTTDQLKKLRAELRSSYQGVNNAFKVPILGGGLEAKQLSMSSKDAEQIKTQMWLRDKIMAAFKNTKASLGIVEDVNRANAEATLDFWRQSVILPKMQRIANAINEFLTPRYGENLVLGVCDPAGEDEDYNINKAKTLKSAGIITRNEARQLIGYEEVEGGDDFGDKPVEVPKSIKNVDYKSVLRKSGIYKKQEVYNKEILPEARKLVMAKKKKHVHEEKPKGFMEVDNSLAEKANDYGITQVEVVESQVKQFDNAISQYIDRLQKRVEAKVAELYPKKQFEDELFNEEQEIRELEALVLPILATVAITAGNNANKLINSSKPFLMDKKLEDIVKRQIDKFGKSMLKTDADKLAQIIADGFKQGHGVAKVTQSIRDEFPQFAKVQAQRISRSELLRTSNTMAVEAWKQSGVVAAKQWLTVSDPCPYCEPMNGKIIGLDDRYFKKGTEYFGNSDTPIKLDYGSVKQPPLHVNCKCQTLPVLIPNKAVEADKIKKQLEEERKYAKELEKIIEGEI